MSNAEEELSDVIVVLVDEPGVPMEDAVGQLQAQGLAIADVDKDNGVVRGDIESDKLPALRRLPFVKYVRRVFNYIAEPPATQAEDLKDVDDAGA